jgi:hypothetical protein
MEIKKFINTIENFRKLDNKEQIPYFIYFLQDIEKQEGIIQADIKKCFEQTNISLSINLSIHFNQNTKKKKGKKPKYIFRKGKYFLENSLEEEIKRKLNTENTLDYPEDIIIHTKLNDIFYDKLIKDINNSFYYEIYTGCFILTRKLFENMIIDILRNNFKREKELFQNQINKKKYNDFSVLLDSLKRKKSELGFTIQEIENIIEKLNLYRIEANSKTHSIVDFGKKEELKKYNIEPTFDLLKRVWQVK